MKGRVSVVLNSPNKSRLGSVGQMPSVGSEVLPANVLGVVPQGAHLKKMMVKMRKASNIV